MKPKTRMPKNEPTTLPPLKVGSETEQLAASLVNERQERDEEREEGQEYEAGLDNPNPELMSDNDQQLRKIADLEEQLAKANQLIAKQNAKLAEVRNQKSNYSDVSRKFRLFQSILQGFAARGAFDQSELAKKKGSEFSLMRHAAGLAEVAQDATTNRF